MSISCRNSSVVVEPVLGANIAESKNAQSTADFISKLSISLKEADETEYWLELLKDSDTITAKIGRASCRERV